MWRDRAAVNVVLARFISRTGGEAAFFVGIWGKAAFEFNATAGQLAALIGALGVSGLIGSPMGGVLIDRYDPRKVLIAGELVFVPVALSFLLVTTIPQIFVAAFLLGLVGSPIYTALASMPPYLTDDPDHLARINSGVETAGMAALISGTSIGALLARFVSVDAIFVFDAVTSVVAVGLVLTIHLRRKVASVRGDSALSELREGLRYSYANARLRFYILAGTSIWLLFGLFGALEPLFFRDVLGTDVEAIGWVNSIFGVGLVLGTATATRLPRSMKGATGLLILIMLNGLGANLYIGFASLVTVTIGGFFWGVVIGWFFPIFRTLVHLNSPDEMIGRITATTQMHGQSATLLPLVMAPWLAVVLGVQVTMMAAGGVVAVGALLFIGKAGQLDRTRAAVVIPVASDTDAVLRAPGLTPVDPSSDRFLPEDVKRRPRR